VTPRAGPSAEACVVLVTAPNADKAVEIARALVELRLAACGNVIPTIRSIYRWQGKVEDGAEAMLVLKTSRDRFAALREKVIALHPYEVPEILELPVGEGNPAYLAWIAESVTASS
jgi:periplasmic divalent cation tolerance protein